MIDIKACEMAVRWSGEDEGYVARVDRYHSNGLNPKHLTGFAKTPECAIQELVTAIHLANETVPHPDHVVPPTTKPTQRDPHILQDPRAVRLPGFMASLKPRVGTRVLYVKDKGGDRDPESLGRRLGCEVDITRCFLWKIAVKKTVSPQGEVDEYTVLLIPDHPGFKDSLALLAKGEKPMGSHVVNACITLDGPAAQCSILLGYDGLDDLVCDRLGHVDPKFDEPPDVDPDDEED